MWPTNLTFRIGSFRFDRFALWEVCPQGEHPARQSDLFHGRESHHLRSRFRGCYPRRLADQAALWRKPGIQGQAIRQISPHQIYHRSQTRSRAVIGKLEGFAPMWAFWLIYGVCGKYTWGGPFRTVVPCMGSSPLKGFVAILGLAEDRIQLPIGIEAVSLETGEFTRRCYGAEVAHALCHLC
jgi:hypothetical protein